MDESILVKMREVVADGAAYDILTALRGPDGDEYGDTSGIVKQCTTGVIRHWLGLTFQTGFWMVSYSREQALKRLESIGMRTFQREFAEQSAHFRGHVRTAFYQIVATDKSFKEYAALIFPNDNIFYD